MQKLHRTRNFRMGAVAAVLYLGLASSALAHARLVTSSPTANSTVAFAPTELRLKFSEGVEISFSKLKLTGPLMIVIETGPARLAADDNSLVIVPVPALLNVGKYTVDWQAVSSDGHRTSGGFVFELAK